MSEQPVSYQDMSDNISKYNKREAKRFPYLPFKDDNSLRKMHGPDYSISLSYLEYYHKHSTSVKFKKMFCRDIMYYVLHITEVIEINNDTGYYTIIDLNNDKYTPLKIHIIEAIECFKFAIAHGYSYYYKRKANKIYNTYHDLETVFKLSFIDLPEVRDFIVYYFSLFPNICYDLKASLFILENSIIWSLQHDGDIDVTILSRLLAICKTVNITIDLGYYYLIHKMIIDNNNNEMISYNQIIKLVQFGIDYGIKADSYNIEFINNWFDHKTAFHLDLNLHKNLYLYRKLKPDRIRNHEEWFNQERGDIYYSNIIKTTFVINEITKQIGANLVNTNLAHLSSIIDKYY